MANLKVAEFRGIDIAVVVELHQHVEHLEGGQLIFALKKGREIVKDTYSISCSVS